MRIRHIHSERNDMIRQILLGCMGGLVAAGASAAGITVEVTDGNGAPLADVVVALELDGQSGAVKAPTSSQIEQRGLKFIPLVSVIQTGTRMLFPTTRFATTSTPFRPPRSSTRSCTPAWRPRPRYSTRRARWSWDATSTTA